MSFKKRSMVCGPLLDLFVFVSLFNVHIYNVITYNYGIKDCVENHLPLKTFGIEGRKPDVDRKTGARGGRGLMEGRAEANTTATLTLILHHLHKCPSLFQL